MMLISIARPSGPP